MPGGDKRPEPTGANGQINGRVGYAGTGTVAEAYTSGSGSVPIPRFLAESRFAGLLSQPSSPTGGR